MFGIIILCLSLFVELWFAYKTSKRALVSPQVIYILGFIPATLFLFPFITKWDIKLSVETYIVLVGGGALFIVASLMISFFDLRIQSIHGLRISLAGRPLIGRTVNTASYKIRNWKLILCAVLQLLAVILLFIHVRNVAGGGGLSTILYNYRVASVDSYISIPTLTQVLRVYSIAAGYVAMFVLINRLFFDSFRGTSVFLLTICVTLGVLTTLVLANRGDAIKMLITGVAQYLAFSIKKNRNRLPWKKLIKVAIGGIIFLLLFQQFGKLVGRTFLAFNIIDYIGVYLSAPIKNLDTYLSMRNFEFWNPVSMGENQTLISITNFIATKFNINSLYHSQYTEFGYQFIGKYELGNCYTCYASYIYDLGYAGIIIYTVVMAFICQVIYFKAKRDIQNIDNITISIPFIIYCILFFEILFSFFAYTFYQDVLHIGFIRQVIFMYLIKWFWLI